MNLLNKYYRHNDTNTIYKVIKHNPEGTVQLVSEKGTKKASTVRILKHYYTLCDEQYSNLANQRDEYISKKVSRNKVANAQSKQTETDTTSNEDNDNG